MAEDSKGIPVGDTGGGGVSKTIPKLGEQQK